MCHGAVDEWLRQSNVWEEEHHGGSINGNGCKRLLERIDVLQQICTTGPCPDFQGLKFIPVLRAFKNVVHCCFGFVLRVGWEDEIIKFKNEYLLLEIRITPKVHAVFFHVPEFCLRHGKGLGLFSEHASESVHSNFNLTWERFRVANINPRQGSLLLRAVADYNTKHL